MSKYRILFINAVNTAKGVGTYPPLGIGYLISTLRKNFEHNSMDFKVVEDKIETEIKKFKPNVVGISCVSANYNLAIKYASIAKEFKLPVIVGGAHISMLPRSLTKDMDIAVLGEGEETICDLLELYKNGNIFIEKKLQGVEGIAYRNKKGEFCITPTRKLIKPLDKIPMPSRELLDINADTYMITSRGCPYKCIYCSSTRFWNQIRLNSAEYVVNEIEHLISEYNIKSIYFCDDIFILSMKRIELMIRLLKERDLIGKLSFTCACRSNLINEQRVSLLKELGVTCITMGFESGCNKTLRFLKGNTVTVEDHEKAIKIIKKYQIEIIGGFIIGSPQESKEDLLETLNFIKRNKLVNVSIYPLTPLPGTPIWDYAKKRSLVHAKMNWDLLAFTEFQYDCATSIHLSEKIDRKKLYGFIQSFRWWRRGYILRSLIRKSFLNPSKTPEVMGFLVKSMISKIKFILFRIGMYSGIRIHKL